MAWKTGQGIALAQIRSGAIVGRRIDGILHFSGVPYGEAPIGPLRFARPQAKSAWVGEFDCTQEPTMAPQMPARLGWALGQYPRPINEDCLRLEIWAPDDLAPGEQVPVLAYVHGGAYMTGSGAQACHSGHVLAKQFRVVVVGVSYRLGALGFLAIPGIAPANLGLHDQVLAFQWIRENIAAFGGQPDNVTAAGQSAGAQTIGCLACLPNGSELFDRAILMSAPLGASSYTLDYAHEVGRHFLEILGTDACRIHELSIERLLDAQASLLAQRRGPAGSILPVFHTTVDADLIPEQPLDALVSGAARWCPLVVGTSRDEMTVFYRRNEELAASAKDTLPVLAEQLFAEHGSQALDRAQQRSPGPALDVLCELFGQHYFERARDALGARVADPRVSTQVYQFDWGTGFEELGAYHCVELPFFFGNFDAWNASPPIARAESEQTRQLSERFQSYLMDFVRGSAHASRPWPAYGAARAVMHFDRKVGVLHH